MKRLCGFILICFLPQWGFAAEMLRLSAEAWSPPRSGERLARDKGLVSLVRALDAAAGLRIRYGLREEDLLWAEELRDWLVALGVPSRRVALVRDPAVEGEVVVELDAQAPGVGGGGEGRP
jgi:hypothetical protein